MWELLDTSRQNNLNKNGRQEKNYLKKDWGKGDEGMEDRIYYQEGDVRGYGMKIYIDPEKRVNEEATQSEAKYWISKGKWWFQK